LAASLSPLLVGLSLASFDDLDQLSRGADFLEAEVLFCGLTLYLTASWALWKTCIGQFDVAVDRPRLDASSRRSPSVIKPMENPSDIFYESPSGAGGTTQPEEPSPIDREP
jgi:hypothetical protein